MATMLRNENDIFRNVKNGEYVLHKYGGGYSHDGGINSITITCLDDVDNLTGSLTFKSGSNTTVIDLSSDRWLGLSGPVSTLDMTVVGVPDEVNYLIILL